MPTKRVYSKNADLWFDLTYTEGDVYNADLDILFDPTAPFFAGDGSGGGGPGTPGADGKSAYELAQDEGFTGTLSEWLESLVGPPGQDGEDGQDGTGGGGPSDAYSPSNKPRLSALGTADFEHIGGSLSPINWRYYASTTSTLTKDYTFDQISVSLVSQNVVGGEELRVIFARLEAGNQWVTRHFVSQVLTLGQTIAEFDIDFRMAAGERWAVAPGFAGANGTIQTDRFLNITLEPLTAPFDTEPTRTDEDIALVVGGAPGFLDGSSRAYYRQFKLRGVNEPKGVSGKADPSDITFSGTTGQRPAGMPVGFAYFDTSLSKPLWFDGSGWRDATGTAA